MNDKQEMIDKYGKVKSLNIKMVVKLVLKEHHSRGLFPHINSQVNYNEMNRQPDKTGITHLKMCSSPQSAV